MKDTITAGDFRADTFIEAMEQVTKGIKGIARRMRRSRIRITLPPGVQLSEDSCERLLRRLENIPCREYPAAARAIIQSEINRSRPVKQKRFNRFRVNVSYPKAP